MSKTFLFQTIQFSVRIVFVKRVLFQTILFNVSTVSMSKTVLFKKKYIVYIQKQFHFQQFTLAKVRRLNFKTVLFHAIRLSRSMLFSSIFRIDRILLDARTPSQSEPWSDGNEYSITKTSASDCLMPYPGHSVCLTPLQRSNWCILRQGKTRMEQYIKRLIY